MKDLEKQIARLAEGDISALGDLYEESKAAIYGLALSIIKNPQDAEDIMQNTYLKIYQSSLSYQPRGRPLAWILKITRNLALDKLRSMASKELPLDSEIIADRDSDFSEAALDRLVLSTVLNKLSEEERQIVMLHSVARLKHREIGEILDIPLGTALSRYHRSLAKLRKLLEEENK